MVTSPVLPPGTWGQAMLQAETSRRPASYPGSQCPASPCHAHQGQVGALNHPNTWRTCVLHGSPHVHPSSLTHLYLT